MPSALTAVPAPDIFGKCVFVSSDVWILFVTKFILVIRVRNSQLWLSVWPYKNFSSPVPIIVARGYSKWFWILSVAQAAKQTDTAKCYPSAYGLPFGFWGKKANSRVTTCLAMCQYFVMMWRFARYQFYKTYFAYFHLLMALLPSAAT